MVLIDLLYKATQPLCTVVFVLAAMEIEVRHISEEEDLSFLYECCKCGHKGAYKKGKYLWRDFYKYIDPELFCYYCAAERGGHYCYAIPVDAKYKKYVPDELFKIIEREKESNL